MAALPGRARSGRERPRADAPSPPRLGVGKQNSYGFFTRIRANRGANPERRARVLDILYVAVGLGFFLLMGAYARWAEEA
jgi:hypothetical protein